MFGWFRKKKSDSPVATAPAPPAGAPPLPSCPGAVTSTVEIPHEKISARAYEIWVRKGRPHGKDFENWIEAEAELRAELAASADDDALPRKPR